MRSSIRRTAPLLAILYALSILVPRAAQGQTAGAQHNLASKPDGSVPIAASTVDAAGHILSAPSSPDDWLGGTGNWSNPADWSAGLPGSDSDVIINTGNDDVTLDTSADINSLTLGGASGFERSTLQGNRTAQTLNIAQNLTVNQSGALEMASDTFNVGGSVSVLGNPNTPAYVAIDFGSAMNVAGNMENSGQMQLTPFGTGGDSLTVAGTFTSAVGSQTIIENASDVASFGTLANSGDLYLQTGATMTLTNEPNGISLILPGSEWEIHGSFTAAGNPAFANLQTVEGELDLENGEATVITPPSGTLVITNGGLLNAPSSLQINGNVAANYRGISGNDVSISGWLSVGYGGDAEGTITVAGGTAVGKYGQVGTIGSQVFTTPTLSNAGFTYLQQNSSMVVGQQSRKSPLGLGYHQLPNGMLSEWIAVDTYGVLQSPMVSLDGTLRIQILPGRFPPVGTRYQFIFFQPGGLTGQFANVENDVFNNGTEKWVLNYNNSGGYVELVAEQNTGTVP